MSAQRPRLITSENPEKLPILIIDKNGIIAHRLVEKLIDQYQIILVTARTDVQPPNAAVIHYGKKIPMLPDRNYSEIIIIHHGEALTLDMLSPISKKAAEINAGVTFITSISLVDKYLEKILFRPQYEKITKLFYGEIFGNEELEQNILTDYINQINQSQKIDIAGSGLQKIYPVLFDDLIDAIITIIFVLPKKAETINILPKHGFTHLSVARAFQKNNPEIKVNFLKQKNREVELVPRENVQHFFLNYPLAEKLNTIKFSPVTPPGQLHSAKAEKSPRKRHTHPRLRLSGKSKWLFFAALFFIVPVILEFGFLLGGGFFLSASIQKAQENELVSAQKLNLLSSISFSVSAFLSDNISFINPVLFIQKDPITQKANIGRILAGIEGDFLDSASLLNTIYSGKSPNPKKDFLQAVAKIKNSLVSLQKLKAEGELPPVVSEKIKSIERPLALLGDTIDALPELMGFDQEKKYLILFQNNMELRPGGGFIGSFALVSIKNGKPGKLEIRDVYDADGKLSTHVEPPFALNRYLGAPHLFLRDSNFDVDFVTNARTAQRFLELETGEKADGVIAIDTSFVKGLISAFGPLRIPDFNETVTADNFYLLTQTHAEKDFFPGSTQKKDFLRGVFNALEMKLSQDKPPSISLLARLISTAIRKKQLLIALPDTQAQKLFSVNNLSGALQDNRLKNDNGILDFLGINEANLGMNKSNYYLKRAIAQKVTLDGQGSVVGKITITYENTSAKDSAFGGDYKNYLRFILPAEAVLNSVEINDVHIPTAEAVTQSAVYSRAGFVPPPQLEVEKTTVSGKTIYGFLTIIPVRSSEKIALTYSLPNAFDSRKTIFTYALHLFKQPGTLDDPYSFSISYPSEFHAIKGSEDFSDVGGKLLYSGQLSSDMDMLLTFSRK